MSDRRRSAPAAGRNRGPITDVLRGILPDKGLVLEVASGTGEHALAFASAFPGLDWQPSDPDPDSIASIEAWRVAEGPANLRPALRLDASQPHWPIDQADAVLCINMVHISPWTATQGLLAGAQRLLKSGSPLYLYGPYRRSGVETAASNEAFDRSLKARNAEWGLRTLEELVAEAQRCALVLDAVVQMPANNLSLVFRRA